MSEKDTTASRRESGRGRARLSVDSSGPYERRGCECVCASADVGRMILRAVRRYRCPVRAAATAASLPAAGERGRRRSSARHGTSAAPPYRSAPLVDVRWACPTGDTAPLVPLADASTTSSLFLLSHSNRSSSYRGIPCKMRTARGDNVRPSMIFYDVRIRLLYSVCFFPVLYCSRASHRGDISSLFAIIFLRRERYNTRVQII